MLNLVCPPDGYDRWEEAKEIKPPLKYWETTTKSCDGEGFKLFVTGVTCTIQNHDTKRTLQIIGFYRGMFSSNAVLLHVENDKYIWVKDKLFEFFTSSPILYYFTIPGNSGSVDGVAIDHDDILKYGNPQCWNYSTLESMTAHWLIDKHNTKVLKSP